MGLSSSTVLCSRSSSDFTCGDGSVRGEGGRDEGLVLGDSLSKGLTVFGDGIGVGALAVAASVGFGLGEGGGGFVSGDGGGEFVEVFLLSGDLVCGIGDFGEGALVVGGGGGVRVGDFGVGAAAGGGAAVGWDG